MPACTKPNSGNFFGSDSPAFDVQLLGIGEEGHTASLFPGSPVLDEKLRWVAAVRVAAEPPQRITLTPVVLNQGRNTFFLVAGENKRSILSAIRAEPGSKASQYPAAQDPSRDGTGLVLGSSCSRLRLPRWLFLKLLAHKYV